MRSWRVPALRLAPTEAVQILMEWLEDERVPSDVRLGDSTRYWQRAAQLALEALAGQRLIPGLARVDGRLYARWLPHLDAHRVAQLAGAMPPVCRALDGGDPAPEPLLRDFLGQTCDALVRAWTSGPLRGDASWPGSDPGLRWARALFGPPRPIAGSEAQAESLQRSHHLWLRNLRLAGDEYFRVALRLSAPERDGEPWLLDFLLQAQDAPSLLVGSGDIWRAGEASLGLRRLTEPREKLLAGLGYAARFFGPLERALEVALGESESTEEEEV